MRSWMIGACNAGARCFIGRLKRQLWLCGSSIQFHTRPKWFPCKRGSHEAMPTSQIEQRPRVQLAGALPYGAIAAHADTHHVPYTAADNRRRTIRVYWLGVRSHCELATTTQIEQHKRPALVGRTSPKSRTVGHKSTTHVRDARSDKIIHYRGTKAVVPSRRTIRNTSEKTPRLVHALDTVYGGR